MSNNTSECSSTASCGCGTGQTRSHIACPICRKAGMTVNLTTPQHTLSRAVREMLDSERSYYFCDNPDCDVVYYNEQDSSVFTTSDLKNRVTIKDDSPETPLCYCFKVLKKQALEEIARTGSSDVFSRIQAKMRPGQSCFCEKANPRGDTCSADILSWLHQQGISTDGGEKSETTACCSAKCCG